MTTRVGLVVSRDWIVDERNPKAAVVRRRLAKARARLDSWEREVALLDRHVSSLAGRRASVLEVACGAGLTLLELANRGYRTTGLEADPALCALANAAARQFSLDCRAIAGDACRLPFASGAFDVVSSRSFFEHVYDRDLALGEQLRVLRPGGLLLINDGNLLNPRLLFDLLFLYPLRTGGRHGGVKWVFTKRRVHKNLYGYLPLGRDEDVKTPRWWRRFLGDRGDCEIIEVGTSAADMFPGAPWFVRPFLGSCQVVAVKR